MIFVELLPTRVVTTTNCLFHKATVWETIHGGDSPSKENSTVVFLSSTFTKGEITSSHLRRSNQVAIEELEGAAGNASTTLEMCSY